MPILERHAAAHLGVRSAGRVEPLCRSWRATWNWTLDPGEVTCAPCMAAIAEAKRLASEAGTPPEP